MFLDRTFRALSLCLLPLACMAGCKDDGECSDEERIAIELHVAVRDDVEITKVTAELEGKEEGCGFFSHTGIVYTCWERGGGTYTIRVYSGDSVIHMEDAEIEWDGCHIKQRYISEVDLTAL